jgi:hypothetical protein
MERYAEMFFLPPDLEPFTTGVLQSIEEDLELNEMNAIKFYHSLASEIVPFGHFDTLDELMVLKPRPAYELDMEKMLIRCQEFEDRSDGYQILSSWLTLCDKPPVEQLGFVGELCLTELRDDVSARECRLALI